MACGQSMGVEDGEIGLTSRARRTVAVVAGLVLVALAMAWLAVHGITGVRASADRSATEPVWWRWLPAVAAALVVAAVPWQRNPAGGLTSADGPRTAVRNEAAVLGAAAVIFTVALIAAAGSEGVHTGGKLLLLVLVPLVAFRWYGSGLSRRPPVPVPGTVLGAALAVVVWALVVVPANASTWAGAPAPTMPGAQLMMVLLGGFVLNAVVEEYFYRRWLQTRFELLLGRWPGIVLVTVLWSSWHAAIQGVGRLDLDLASVLVAHAATGVLLGPMWSRYRRMWPLLTVHGALNALPVLVAVILAP